MMTQENQADEHITEARQQGRASGLEEAVTWLVQQRHIPGIVGDSAIRALNKGG